MALDYALWVAIGALLLGIFALLPPAYQYLLEQLWPLAVDVRFPGGIAQAGGTVNGYVDIANQTRTRVYVSIGFTMRSSSQTLGFNHFAVKMTRHGPMNLPFTGLLELAPFERDSVTLFLVPGCRGSFRFDVSVWEGNHWSRFPRWVRFQRRVLLRKNPRLHVLEWNQPIAFDVDSWMSSPEGLQTLRGTPQNEQERDADATYAVAQAERIRKRA